MINSNAIKLHRVDLVEFKRNASQFNFFYIGLKHLVSVSARKDFSFYIRMDMVQQDQIGICIGIGMIHSDHIGIGMVVSVEP